MLSNYFVFARIFKKKMSIITKIRLTKSLSIGPTGEDDINIEISTESQSHSR
jgi:hypothetical protein